MDVRERHLAATQEFQARLRLVPVDRWKDPIPCPRWDVATLVRHVIDTQRWAPRLLQGATLEDAAAEVAEHQRGPSASEAFADPVPVQRTADPQTRLLAMLGRAR